MNDRLTDSNKKSKLVDKNGIMLIQNNFRIGNLSDILKSCQVKHRNIITAIHSFFSFVLYKFLPRYLRCCLWKYLNYINEPDFSKFSTCQPCQLYYLPETEVCVFYIIYVIKCINYIPFLKKKISEAFRTCLNYTKNITIPAEGSATLSQAKTN